MANETVTKARRSKGDGTIFKNSKGIWIARYVKKGMSSKQFTGKTKMEAKAKLDEYKFLIQSGEVISQKLTVADYSMKFLYFKGQQVKRQKLKQSTYDLLESIFISHIKSRPISKVLMCNLKSLDIQSLLDNMQDHYSFSTINKVYLFLHSMVTHAIEEKDLPESFDPFVTVELPAESAVGVKTKCIEIIPNEYLDKIKEVALSYHSDGTLSYRYGPALIFALNTGLREGEIIALSKNGIIRNAETRYKQIITPPKYPRSDRIIPLNPEAVMCFDIMVNTYEPHMIREDLIISTKTGNFPTLRNIQETLDRILRKCGVKHYGTHALRHPYGKHTLKTKKTINW